VNQLLTTPLIFYLYQATRAKLQPGLSSPAAKQYGDRWTNQPTDKVSYRGAMLAPKNTEVDAKRWFDQK